MGRDSSIARLSTAWQSGSAGGVVSLARESLLTIALRAGLGDARERDGVLWLRATDGPTPPAAVRSLEAGHRNFRIQSVTAAAATDVESVLRQRHPRLLVADVQWCTEVGLATVRRLHRHAPQVDWLLCWDEPSPCWLEMLVNSGARGAVLRQAGPVELARAFDSVVAGELWLPRRVLHWLYASMVDTSGHDGPATAPASAWPSDSQLTHREVEVVGLLRQGLTNREIGERLGVSINTVKKHVASAYEKRGIRSRRQTLA